MLTTLKSLLVSLDLRQRLALALVVASVAAFAAWSVADGEKTVDLLAPKERWRVVLADTPQLRAAGLSGRDEMPADGMLLVWDNEGRHPIWMHEMRFSLDLVWLDDDGRVLAIVPDVPPCKDQPCVVYEPPGSARSTAVLELPAGQARSYRIAAGVHLDRR